MILNTSINFLALKYYNKLHVNNLIIIYELKISQLLIKIFTYKN